MLMFAFGSKLCYASVQPLRGQHGCKLFVLFLGSSAAEFELSEWTCLFIGGKELQFDPAVDYRSRFQCEILSVFRLVQLFYLTSLMRQTHELCQAGHNNTTALCIKESTLCLDSSTDSLSFFVAKTEDKKATAPK